MYVAVESHFKRRNRVDTLENAVARLRLHYSYDQITKFIFSHANVSSKNKLVLLLLVCRARSFIGRGLMLVEPIRIPTTECLFHRHTHSHNFNLIFVNAVSNRMRSRAGHSAAITQYHWTLQEYLCGADGKKTSPADRAVLEQLVFLNSPATALVCGVQHCNT